MMPKPAWLPDEFIQVGLDFSLPQQAKQYDQYMNRIRDISDENQKVVSTLKLTGNESILEIGTGTGELAIFLSSYCRRVHAIDVSDAMLSQAIAKATLLHANNIQFQKGGFLTYAFAPESYDAIVSQLALHHLPDTWKLIALNRIYKALKSGGRFYLKDIAYTFAPDRYAVYFDNLISLHKHYYGPEAEKTAITFIKEEYPTLDWMLTEIITCAGFTIERHTSSQEFISTYICVKA